MILLTGPSAGGADPGRAVVDGQLSRPGGLPQGDPGAEVGTASGFEAPSGCGAPAGCAAPPGLNRFLARCASSSTYSWPDRFMTAYMISSVTARSTSRSVFRPA